MASIPNSSTKKNEEEIKVAGSIGVPNIGKEIEQEFKNISDRVRAVSKQLSQLFRKEGLVDLDVLHQVRDLLGHLVTKMEVFNGKKVNWLSKALALNVTVDCPEFRKLFSHSFDLIQAIHKVACRVFSYDFLDPSTKLIIPYDCKTIDSLLNRCFMGSGSVGESKTLFQTINIAWSRTQKIHLSIQLAQKHPLYKGVIPDTDVQLKDGEFYIRNYEGQLFLSISCYGHIHHVPFEMSSNPAHNMIEGFSQYVQETVNRYIKFDSAPCKFFGARSCVGCDNYILVDMGRAIFRPDHFSVAIFKGEQRENYRGRYDSQSNTIQIGQDESFESYDSIFDYFKALDPKGELGLLIDPNELIDSSFYHGDTQEAPAAAGKQVVVLYQYTGKPHKDINSPNKCVLYYSDGAWTSDPIYSVLKPGFMLVPAPSSQFVIGSYLNLKQESARLQRTFNWNGISVITNPQ